MAFTCRTPLVAFMLLNFILAPLACFGLGLCFGAILAAAEGWPVAGASGEVMPASSNRPNPSSCLVRMSPSRSEP